MLFRFASEDLGKLYADPSFKGRYGVAVVRAFRKVMGIIKNAVDERDFYKLASLHFEKLSGNRSHQRSMKLNDQWRLILEIESGEPKNTVVVINIEDYH